jgi:hypothetical protein
MLLLIAYLYETTYGNRLEGICRFRVGQGGWAEGRAMTLEQAVHYALND